MNHSRPIRYPAFHQHGVTLVVALVFLLALSMLGIWSASNNALEERMAGNTRNRDLAFEAAEAALEDAEATISDWHNGPFNGNGGLFMYRGVNESKTVTATQQNDAQYWRDLSFWTTTNSRQVLTARKKLEQVAQRPRYIIEKMSPVGDLEYYRITARGVGGDSNAVVILQSIITYKKS